MPLKNIHYLSQEDIETLAEILGGNKYNMAPYIEHLKQLSDSATMMLNCYTAHSSPNNAFSFKEFLNDIGELLTSLKHNAKISRSEVQQLYKQVQTYQKIF